MTDWAPATVFLPSEAKSLTPQLLAADTGRRLCQPTASHFIAGASEAHPLRASMPSPEKDQDAKRHENCQHATDDNEIVRWYADGANIATFSREELLATRSARSRSETRDATCSTYSTPLKHSRT